MATKPMLPPIRPGFNKYERYRDPQAPTADQIADWITKHGVTRCPAAALDVTTAEISPDDRAALLEHQAKMEEAEDAVTWARRAAQKRGNSISARQASSVSQREKVRS